MTSPPGEPDAPSIRSERYLFAGERLAKTLESLATDVVDDSTPGIEESWDDLIDDGSDHAFIFSSTALKAEPFRRAISRALQSDWEYTSAVLDHVAQVDETHANCETAILSLRALRDDVLAGIMEARRVLYNEISFGEYGDLLVNAEEVLDAVRPRWPSTASDLRRLPASRDWCPRCAQHAEFEDDHHDHCQQTQRDTFQRLSAAVTSHTACEAMVDALHDQVRLCVRRVEQIADYVDNYADFERDGTRVVRPSTALSLTFTSVLSEYRARHQTAIDLATHVEPPLEDPSYCDEDAGEHHSPHRACRDLIS